MTDRDSLRELTSFQRDLLYVIAGLSEPYGVAVKNELEAYYDKRIHAGQLYPGLDTLVNKGLVQKDDIDGRTKAYNLTDRGRHELKARRDWMDQYLSEIAGEWTERA